MSGATVLWVLVLAPLLAVQAHPLRLGDDGASRLDDLSDANPACADSLDHVADTCAMAGASSSDCSEAREQYLSQDCGDVYRDTMAKLSLEMTRQGLPAPSSTHAKPSWFSSHHGRAVTSARLSAATEIRELGERTLDGLIMGSVITLRGASRANGTAGLYCSTHANNGTSCSSKVKQHYTVLDAGSGYVALKVGESELCEDGKGGKKLCSHPASSTGFRENEMFKVKKAGQGRITLRDKASGLYCSDAVKHITCNSETVGKPEVFAVKCVKKCYGSAKATVDSGRNTCDLSKPYPNKNVQAIRDYFEVDPVGQLLLAIKGRVPKSCSDVTWELCFHPKFAGVVQTTCCKSCSTIKQNGAGNGAGKSTSVSKKAYSPDSDCLLHMLSPIQDGLPASMPGPCNKSEHDFVTAGTSCAPVKPGFMCNAAKCVDGNWTILSPNCEEPKGCRFADLKVSGANVASQDIGCSANDTLVQLSGGDSPSGANCSFIKVGFTCGRADCRNGQWSRENVVCKPDSVAAEEAMQDTLQNQLNSMQQTQGGTPI